METEWTFDKVRFKKEDLLSLEKSDRLITPTSNRPYPRKIRMETERKHQDSSGARDANC